MDELGCTRQGAIALAGVHFANASAILADDSTTVLDRVAADLIQYPNLEIELQGHTDSVGSQESNQRLSRRRAEAVRDYLLSKGVRSSQAVARGYGESQPVSDNTTPKGRSENRRVVMMVLQNPGNVAIKNEHETL